MDQVTDNIKTIDLQEEKVDASADNGGTGETAVDDTEGTDVDVCIPGDVVGGDIEGTDVDASVDIFGAHGLDIEDQLSKHDAKGVNLDVNTDIVGADRDHGAASTDARVLRCFGTTSTDHEGTSLPSVSQVLDAYDMNHKYRGHALLINNEKFSIKLREQGLGNRDGSSVDERVMKKRLHELGFTVTNYHDLKASQMRMVISQLAAKDHSECDCFICVILSHGEEGLLYGTDKTIEIKELTKYFKGDVCPTLVGKPKIFVIQACRGYQTDPGVKVNVIDAQGKTSDETDAPEVQPTVIKLPIEADFLFAYSTIPGYYSWRNGMNGSWFIQALAEALKDFGNSMEIRKLLTLVNKKVAQNFQSFNPDTKAFHKMKQIPCITSMLTKDLYFSTIKKRRVLQH